MKRASIALALICVLAGLNSCRTAQQARRNQASARSAAGGANSSGVRNDSLLIVEQRLVEVIDSMTSLVESDHSRIRALEQEVAALRARMEGRMLPSTSGQTYPIQSQPTSVTGPSTETAYPPPAANPAPPTYSAPNAPSFATASMQDRYATALRLFNENNFTGALSAFQQLEQDDPNGQYAPNYKYWEGESLYAMGKYSDALQAFSDVAGNYPTSGKADDASFKIAESYERLGMTSSARSAYERLIADYPKSEYRSRAEARVRKLR